MFSQTQLMEKMHDGAIQRTHASRGKKKKKQEWRMA